MEVGILLATGFLLASSQVLHLQFKAGTPSDAPVPKKVIVTTPTAPEDVAKLLKPQAFKG